MRRVITIVGAFLFLLATSAALAQDSDFSDPRASGMMRAHAITADAAAEGARSAASPDVLTPPVPTVRMSPELALTSYLGLAKRQLAELGAYSDVTIVEADLPDTKQHGKFELRRYFQAPRSMAFAALHFAGDGFVKTNVISRILQSEVDHVQKGEGARTAITGENYKFSYKGTETSDGHVEYIYQVKPRHKEPGLFKGRIFVDSATGRLHRAEGQMVKSPSFFIKKIEFVQEYGECGEFSLPVHIHSEARTRLVGRAVVEISHSDYRAITLTELNSASSASGSSGASN